MCETYEYSGWEFTTWQIDQIVKAVEQHQWKAMNGKIDRRGYMPQVQAWMVSRGIAVWVCHHGYRTDVTNMWNWNFSPRTCPEHDNAPKACRWCMEWAGLDDYMGKRKFTPEWDIPAEALWRMVKRFLYHESGEVRGKSVFFQRAWIRLGIVPEGHAWDNPHERDSRENVMLALSQAGYMYVQSAGSIWQFTPLKEDEDEKKKAVV